MATVHDIIDRIHLIEPEPEPTLSAIRRGNQAFLQCAYWAEKRGVFPIRQNRPLTGYRAGCMAERRRP